MLTYIRRLLKSDKGFTLIELMVVVIILGILAAVAIPKFVSKSDDAKLNRVYADLKTISNAVELYHFDQNHFPADTSVLESSKYLKNKPSDPWNANGKYTINGDGSVYFENDLKGKIEL